MNANDIQKVSSVINSRQAKFLLDCYYGSDNSHNTLTSEEYEVLDLLKTICHIPNMTTTKVNGHIQNIVTNNEGTFYYLDGKLHRNDGPAVIRKDYESWYKNDQLHREDGPAVEYTNGTKEWWLNGKPLSEKEFIQTVK